MKVVKMLGLDNTDQSVFLGFNLHSTKLETKGIIKVQNKFFKPKEINKIALVAPRATLTIIENYNVKQKTVVKVPDEIIGLVQCPNSKCITNHEQVETKFKVISKSGDIQIKCQYCEKVAGKDEMKMI
jgi:aspartate carbamoyltransferase regulatory subunit